MVIDEDLKKLHGKYLGIVVAKGMIKLAKEVKFPTTLSELDSFNDFYIKRALKAAKNPQLDMKLKNMPIPLDTSLIDEYMGSILKAAKFGDFRLIKNLK